MSGNVIINTEPGTTIASRLRQLAEENADKDAFVFYDKNMKRTALSRQEVWVHSQRFAAVLRQRGVCRGDVVCNTLPNSPQRLISCLGTILAGAATMHGQTFLTDGEDILHTLRKAKCTTVILDPHAEKGFQTILNRLKEDESPSGNICYKSLPDLKHTIPISLKIGENGKTWIEQFEEEQSELFVNDAITDSDITFITTTSGTTGFSKLIPLSHKEFFGVQLFSRFMIRGSRFYNQNSLGWNAGLPIIYLQTGTTRVLLDYSLGPPENIAKLSVQIFNQEKCDSAFILPSEVVLISNFVNSGNVLSTPLRSLITGGGPLSKTMMSAIGRVTHEVVGVYGASEIGMISAIHVSDPASYDNSCVGCPRSDTEIEIRDVNLKKLPVGETGEIFIRRKSGAKRYMNDTEKSKETFLEDGWLRTGDIGHMDSKGQLFVYCRKSFTINHKAYIHYPGWMEKRIDLHPGIEKSIVVGIPDPETIEEIGICVIPKAQTNLTSDDVIGYFKSLFLTNDSDKMTPTPKCCLFFDAFPLNANRKIDRKALRLQVLSRLGMETSDTPMRE